MTRPDDFADGAEIRRTLVAAGLLRKSYSPACATREPAYAGRPYLALDAAGKLAAAVDIRDFRTNGPAWDFHPTPPPVEVD